MYPHINTAADERVHLGVFPHQVVEVARHISLVSNVDALRESARQINERVRQFPAIQSHIAATQSVQNGFVFMIIYGSYL